jgi:extracellular elastinolytic metalloproteinase
MTHGSRLARALIALALGGLVVLSGAVAPADGNSARAPQPGYLSAPAQGKPVALALRYLREHASRYGLTAGDLREVFVTSTSTDAHTGVTHVYLRQRLRGIDVYGGDVTVNVARNGAILSVGTRLVPRLEAAAGGVRAARTAVDAVRSAARHLDIDGSSALKVLDRQGGAAKEVVLSGGRISRTPIPAKLVWQPAADGSMRLAWTLDIAEGSEHLWSVRVDAVTGAVLDTADFMSHDNAGAIAAAIARPGSAGAATAIASLKTPDPVEDGSSYRVFELPKESPTDGGQTVVANPADANASPFGWHDTDGVAGPEFTITRGNNVHAYADRTNDNAPDTNPEAQPDGGTGLDFDFLLDLDSEPIESQSAYVTNLFYWNNLMHDISQRYGFTEVAGNFQQTNYSGLGLGTDYVRAEAQDGNGRNNANFGTPTEPPAQPGQVPRMQMFEWRSAAPNPIAITSGALAGQTFFGPMAGFGSSLVTEGPISGTIVYVDDGVAAPAPPGGLPGTVNDGCETFTVPAGSIPMMDRGLCNFTVKVKNAQNAGAEFAIVVNNNAQPPVAMAGADNTVTIPSVMVSQADGVTLKAHVPMDATVSDGTGGVPHRDSDIDNGVIAHEYGHGISNRLTGGPAINCLNNLEQMGEGWSDFWGLTLTHEPDDAPTTARGVGTYVSFQPENGLGIRPAQYTTDMTVNPWTYAGVADTVNISVPHGIGFIWNSMLWEVYWNLIAKHGYNADVYGAWDTAGNNDTIQLVVDGMKMQGCSPGFVNGRDGILSAETALTDGDDVCQVRRGFAKRGLGTSASQGSSNNRSDGVQAFDYPAACDYWVRSYFGATTAPPGLNRRNAGSSSPVVFSLGGNKGTEFSFSSRAINCTTKTPVGGLATERDDATGTLLYDGATGRYTFSWKTQQSWAGTCRQLLLEVNNGGSEAVAYYSFA